MLPRDAPQAPKLDTERKLADAGQFLLPTIVEFSDDAILWKSLEGIIQSWNRGAQRLFGYSEGEAVGRPITIIIPEELRDEEKEILRKMRNGEHIEHYETRRVAKDGRTIHVSLTISPIRNAEGRIIGASKIARDITERKLAEAALRESEERFRVVANTAPVMIWTSGVDKLCNYANQPSIDFIGRPAEAILGNGWTEGIHPDDLERSWITYSQAFDEHQPFRMEYRLRRYDGEYRRVIDSGVPRFNADGSFAGYIGSAIDVTEQKLAADALSTISQRLIQAQEQERSRLARELHDDINQKLAMLTINLEALKEGLPASAVELGRQIEQARQQIAAVGSDIQALSHRLYSPKLGLLGLAATTSSFCKEFSDQQKVEIDFQPENVPRELPQDIALCLFRVLQEALQNAAKHSGSRHFRVALKGGANEIELIVHDSGVGFERGEAVNGPGLGLTSMQERLKMVSGQLSIDSKLQNGTTLRARVPLHSGTSSPGTGGSGQSEHEKSDAFQTHSPYESEVLLRLFNLLEQYAPNWYTEEHHNGAVAALRSSRKQH